MLTTSAAEADLALESQHQEQILTGHDVTTINVVCNIFDPCNPLSIYGENITNNVS